MRLRLGGAELNPVIGTIQAEVFEICSNFIATTVGGPWLLFLDL